MKQTSLDREIRTRIDAFLQELSAMVRQSALDAVRSALGAPAVASAPAAASAPAPKRAAAPRRAAARGGKRTSEEVNAMAANVLEYIKSHEGERLEQIAAGMNLPSKELKLPIQKLFGEKLIHTTGNRRGTKYFAGGVRAAAPRKRGGGRKRKA